MPLVRFFEVGACELRRFSRAHRMDVYVFVPAGEKCLEREVFQHGCARSAALGIRFHRRQGVLDLVRWTTVVGVAVSLHVSAVLVTIVVAFAVVMFGSFVAMMGVILVSASARVYVGEVRCVCPGQA